VPENAGRSASLSCFSSSPPTAGNCGCRGLPDRRNGQQWWP
jgi:hypothetical protein